MSASNLNKFLKKLHNELSIDSDDYRRLVTNKKKHVFTYKSSDIREAIKEVLKEAIGQDEAVYGDENFKKAFDVKLAKFTRRLRKNFHGAKSKAEKIFVEDIDGGVVAVFHEYEYKKGPSKGKSRSNYDAILGLYETELNTFYGEFLEILKTGGSTAVRGRKGKRALQRQSGSSNAIRNLKGQSDVFNLGHQKLSNIEHMLNHLMHRALTNAFNNTKLPKGLEQSLKNQFPEFGEKAYKAILAVWKQAQSGEVHVSIESKILNIKKGGKEEQQLSRDLKNTLEKMDIPNLDGSDSLVSAHRKKLIKAIADSYLKIEGVKVKIEDVIIKESGPKSISHEAKTKTITRKGSIGSKKTLARKKGAKQTTPNLASILGFLNMKLPDVVAGNMGDPRLNYRTGRFAQGVRATDVSLTPQGFPSIGYTYEKSKYGQFESTSGTRFADIDRDPRPLIDASIREIVMQLGMGRIYTRRQ